MRCTRIATPRKPMSKRIITETEFGEYADVCFRLNDIVSLMYLLYY